MKGSMAAYALGLMRQSGSPSLEAKSNEAMSWKSPSGSCAERRSIEQIADRQCNTPSQGVFRSSCTGQCPSNDAMVS